MSARVRRMVCKGGCGRWWYLEVSPRGGRPVERCPRCRAMHEAARRRDNHRNYSWKRSQLRLPEDRMTLDPTHGDWIRVLRVNAMCLDERAFDHGDDLHEAAEVARDLANDLAALDLFNASVGRAEGT